MRQLNAFRGQVIGLSLTLALLVVIETQVLRTAADPANASAQFYVPAATTAAAVFVLAFGIPAVLRSFEISVAPAIAWIIGAVSFALAFIPWLALQTGNSNLASWVYHGTHVPQGQVRFWDLSLVLESLDCHRFGFDVFAQHNGCLAQPAIYGPGVLWWAKLPGHPFSSAHLEALGLVMLCVSSLCLLWLARMTKGPGVFVLLATALGAPWLLLLERGNIDAVVLWVAVAVIIGCRRWNRIWMWTLAAAAIWVVGTWKYYPFALGLMLVPSLRLRRGWIVFAAFILASGGYVLATWQNFTFSAQSNSAMANIGDVVALGRVDIVARMVGAHVPGSGFGAGDLLVWLCALAALVWGASFGASIAIRVWPAMLAAGCSAVFLSAVLLAGFGWAYKAAFLAACIPLVSLARYRSRLVLFSSLSMLICIGICSVVVWNTLMASLAGIIAGAFSLGAALVQLLRFLRERQPSFTAGLSTNE